MTLNRWLQFVLMLFLWASFLPATGQADSTLSITPADNEMYFAPAATLLQEKSFKQKAQAVELLVGSTHPRSKSWLQALLKGELYFQRTTGRMVIVGDSIILDALDNQVISGAEKSAFKKITINNKLRKQLRNGIAQLSISSPDVSIRLKAVNDLLGAMNQDHAALLNERIADEPDSDVRAAMSLGINIVALDSSDTETQLEAIMAVADSLHPEVRNRLTALAQHSDGRVVDAAQQTLQGIEDEIAFYNRVETLFFGLSLGSVLVLAAIGLAITFGVMGVINMAHGELIMLGAYTTYLVQQMMPNYLDYSLFVAIPAAFAVSGLMGTLIERTVIRHLYGRPLETLLATFGISLILQQAVRTLISPQNVPVSNPSWMSGTLEINTMLSLTLNRMYIILFSLLVFAVLFMILRKTNLGLQVRAVSQNRAMARSMGVRSARVDALTFGLGSGIAGVAGVALSQLTNVGPNLGQAYIIDSFMVVVFGGVGNLWGTLVAGLSLGVFNKVLEPWAGAVLAKILVLLFIILFIQKRPRGLFPQKGRAAGD